MLKDDPLREPLSEGAGQKKRRHTEERKRRGRQIRAEEVRKRGVDGVDEEKRRRQYRTSSGRKGGKDRQRGGEGAGSQAALYPDRSPLHTNFLVKEEKMALNPQKSFSPGAGLSAEG